MRVKICGLIFLAFSLSFFNSFAQTVQPDSMLYSSAATQVIDYFNRVTAIQSEIYNGAEYELYPPANKGSFYFMDKNYCTPSVICCSGAWYKNIPVLYDIYNDAMVATSDSGLYVLREEKVSDVYLLNHHFIHVNAESPGSLISGFYDQLYSGKSQVLVKRIKLIDESKSTETVYEDKSDLYIKKGNKYYLVNTRGALMDIFKDKKKLLNQYMAEHKIKYNKDKEAAAAKLASYYDQISN